MMGIFGILKSLFKMIYYYITRILPLLVIISIFLVLIGMIIKIGFKAGQAVLVIVGTGLALSYVLYGDSALDVFKKIYKKFAAFFFYPITSMVEKGVGNVDEDGNFDQ